ncbi:MAG: hypothetical protein NC937_02670, partial [Candidatus Omnitrophica bacterium]|nr:hypothetical protein [Candidatus Omnitrophota bacterium]
VLSMSVSLQITGEIDKNKFFHLSASRSYCCIIFQNLQANLKTFSHQSFEGVYFFKQSWYKRR